MDIEHTFLRGLARRRLDVVIGYYWRRRDAPIARKVLSSDYMLLFWNQKRTLNTVGPNYYLRLKNSSKLERAHVFTAFENRLGLQFTDGIPWSTCLLIRVYNKNRKIRIPRQDKVSHTKGVYEDPEADMYTWGPFLGDMSEKVYRNIRFSVPTTVVAGGSAAGYAIDALQQAALDANSQLNILYTTSDAAVMSWVLDIVVYTVQQFPEMGSVRITLALTGDEAGQEISALKKIFNQKLEKLTSSSASSGLEIYHSMGGTSVSMQHGRLDFDKQLEDGCVTFFQGSGGLQKAIQAACRKKAGTKFIAGPAYDHAEQKKESILAFLRRKIDAKRSEVV